MQQSRATLRRIWGYHDFRDGQREVVAAVRAGRDVLAVLPTGGGKSLCFQVPALLASGVTVVVSPLISLMQDQVAALRGRGVAAAYLSSTQRPSLQQAVWETLAADRLKLLYVAPERLRQLVGRVPRGRIALLAVDEAHCISEWGHDFRPHYRAIGVARRAFGDPQTVAVTATATPGTRRDILTVLGIPRATVITTSFDRPNLFFAARRVRSELERLNGVTGRLHRLAGSAVIYVPTRDRTDGVAAILRARGFLAAPYHAGLPGSARRALLGRFLDGRIRVMVATNAFGMGIDKADVRLVAHLGVPPRPEAYIQEAGRAGRDGKAAHCELLWLPRDLDLARKLAGLERDADRRRLRAARREGFKAMRRYLRSRGCRRRVLLGYLGERTPPCGACDGCTGGSQTAVGVRFLTHSAGSTRQVPRDNP